MMSTIDPLPSWNQGAAKQSILDFVARVTTDRSPDFVPPNKRIGARRSTTSPRMDGYWRI
jgi:hypothetical protein